MIDILNHPHNLLLNEMKWIYAMAARHGADPFPRVPTVEELQHLLYPVERYAVALYEELYPATPEERGERSAPLPQREAWSLHDVEERRGMLDAGFNPDELLFCNAFDRETARRVYLSSVRAAQGPRPRFTLLAK